MKKLLLTSSLTVAMTVFLSAQYISILGLQPQEMAYSKVTNRLYVTLQQTVQFDTLELVVVNPANAIIEDTLRFPGRPLSLAVSNDGQHLFVGSILPSHVRRINLSTGMEELSFMLQSNASAIKIVPSPNDFNTIVVVEAVPPPNFALKVACYDGSVRRPADVQNSENVIFRDNNTLLGIQNAAGNNVIIYQLTAAGITQAAVGSVDNYPPNTTMKMVAGRLVMSNGRIYQFNGLYPQYYSFYFNEPFQSGRSFAADPDSAVVYFALDWHVPGSKITLHTYKNNGTTQSVLGIGGLAGSAQYLTDCGGHGQLAFQFAPNTGGLKLVILHPCKSNVPAPVITPSGLGGCDTDTITLSGPAGAAGYFWSNGSNEMSINAMYQNSYTLAVLGPDGCLSPASAPIQILTDSRPPACTFVNNSVERICEGESVTLTAIPPSGWESIIDHYLWSNGATAQSITVSSAGSFTVSAVTTQGCIGVATFPLQVIVNPLPPMPEIQVDSNVLSGPFAFGYKWFLDGLPLLAETGPSILPTEAGFYTLQVVSLDGCLSPLSAPVYWNMVNTHDPLSGIATIPELASSFCLRDVKGAIVCSGTLGAFETLCPNLPQGLYFAQWFDADARFLGTTKWLKM